MPRERDVDAAGRQRAAATQKLAELVKLKGPRKMRARKDLAGAVARRLRSGDWAGTPPAELVELYCWCHQMTYGVRPPELDRPGAAGAKERRGAVSAARSLLENEFRGDSVSFAGYLKWAWMREGEREVWARGKGVQRSRLGWRALFSSRAVFGDFQKARAEAARRSVAGRASSG